MNTSDVLRPCFFRLRAISCFGMLASVAMLLPGDVTAQTNSPPPVYRWTTIAGRASVGAEDGSAAEARFNHPHGLARDALGNLYVADTGNHTIRKITPAGLVSTLAGRAGVAGSADGAGGAARFNRPEAVGVDANGNVYVADTGNHTIRFITPGGAVTTLGGRPGTAGQADGAAANALFDSPDRLVIAPDGTVYLTNHGLRRIAGGQVTTLSLPDTARAANGTTVPVSVGMCAVGAEGRLYFRASITDPSVFFNRCLVRLELDGTFRLWWHPNDYSTLGWSEPTIFNDVFGNLYLTHNYPGIGGTPGFREGWAYNPATNALTQRTTFVGAFGEMDEVRGFAADAQTGRWFYTRASDSAIIGSDGVAFAGTAGSNRIEDGTGPTARFTEVMSLTPDPSGNLWLLDRVTRYGSLEPYWEVKLRKITPTGATTTPSSVPLPTSTDYSPGSLNIAIDGADNKFVSYYQIGAQLTRFASPGTWETLPFPQSHWQPMRGMATAPDGKLYFTGYDAIVYRYESGGTLTALAGGSTSTTKQDGVGAAVKFNSLLAVCADRAGNLYVLDAWDTTCYVRQITPAGNVTTLTDRGYLTVNVDQLHATPSGLAVDSQQNIYLSYRSKSVTRTDSFGWTRSYSYGVNTLRRITPTGEDTMIGSSPGDDGSTDGLTSAARFNRPSALALDGNNNLYVIDDEGRTLRKGVFVGTAPAITTQPANATASAGAAVTFTVVATNTPSPSYQWYRNGTLIGGATSGSLTISGVRPADAGDYTVVVTNELGSVTSNPATLTVSAASTPPPASGGSGGGGGAPSLWFALAALALLGARRRRV